jgi:hypothetical protein
MATEGSGQRRMESVTKEAMAVRRSHSQAVSKYLDTSCACGVS